MEEKDEEVDLISFAKTKKITKSQMKISNTVQEGENRKGHQVILETQKGTKY